MEILRNFAVFEGPDGSGTTTQLNILDDFFHPKKGYSGHFMAAESGGSYMALPPFYKTFEPTDGSIGKLIRSGLRKEVNLRPETVAMLFAADRCEHLYGPGGGVKERCDRGELVVSDRYVPSSLVYQGITCGDKLPEQLNRDFPGPELLIYFDIDSEIAEKRIAGREQREIYEYLDFQIQVRRRYQALLPRFAAQGVRVETIDASLPPEAVAAKIWILIREMPIFKG